MARAVLAAALLGAQLVASQSTWCGKNYEHGSPVVPPGGTFPALATSSTPLLAFRCAPGVVPYLSSDANGTLLVDAITTHERIAGAAPLDSTTAHTYTVTARANDVIVASGAVPVNASKFELPLSFHGLHPSMTPADLECTLVAGAQTFAASAKMPYMPENAHGSTTKRDLKTGALLARGSNGKGPWEPVLPVGFYTDFGSYLATNLSALDDIKAQGFNVVHPIPTFDNLTALALVLDRMEELGLWLMYDMRWTYMNLTAVEQEVLRIQNRTNLLLWYTADEPDGWGDPQNATTLAYDKIYSLDHGYHPVSLVLNCENYFYQEYAAGADILLQDTYVVGNNVTWSSQWNTACTPEYGDCGCDNCAGNFTDVSHRMDTFANRDRALGWELTKAAWTVPQGFGNETYWKRYPTGQEWLVQAAIALNHGATGVVSWDAPSTPDITAAASQLARAVPQLAPFLFSHTAVFAGRMVGGVDVGVWTVGAQALVLATNTAYASARLSLAALGLQNATYGGKAVLANGAKLANSVINLDGVGTGIFVVSTKAEGWLHDEI